MKRVHFNHNNSFAMKSDQIGMNAGKICHYLDKDLTDTRLEKVAKECKINWKDFFLAMGWLARENKIKILDLNDHIYLFPPNT